MNRIHPFFVCALVFMCCFAAAAAKIRAAETALPLTGEKAEREMLTFPILFAKQGNYQGIHIYDTFYQWHPGGGIYVLENPADPQESQRVRTVINGESENSLGKGVYFDPTLSYDAKRILFCYKGSPHGNSVIYEIGVDGTGLRQVTNLDKNGNPYEGGGGGHHDVQPAYLPDGRIIFCSTRYSGLVPCANNGVATLHVMNADGTDVHTISVNNVTEFDPAVMPDGRVLFGRWEYVDKNALTIQSLWTVLPDGTNETALYANNMVFPEAILDAKPVPGNPYLVAGTFCPHNAPPRGTVAVVDTRVGKNDPAAITNFETPQTPTHDRGESCEPWPLNENVMLYSGLAPGDALNSLMLIDRAGNRVSVRKDAEMDLHNPIPLLPRAVPPVVADVTDRGKITGDFFVHDVYEGLEGVPRGAVKYLRVLEETSRVSASPGSNGYNQTFSISAALAWSAKIYHGIVPVEADGSVYFTAPSGRALYFQLLDQDYRMVRSMRTFIQAAPGVTRSCTGCHEYKYGTSDTAMRAPGILGRVPRKLEPESWGTGYMDYASRVQPILDTKCVSCHGGEKGMAAGLDLSGGWTQRFNISYENLTARREKMYVADLVQGICCMNATADWSCAIFPPYSHGTGNAPLADVLLAPEHRAHAGLTDAERELIFAWVDSNAVYYGTWDFTRSGPVLGGYDGVKNQLKAVMRDAGCATCHGDLSRFENDWVNFQRPEFSRILRAPLAAVNKNDRGTAENGYGLGLCRAREVDNAYSRLGLLTPERYLHQVQPLVNFPTQKWRPWDAGGESAVTFKSVEDLYYRKMLRIIQRGRAMALARPRVDMQDVYESGVEIVAGRSRQIIPQPLPEKMPALEARLTEDGAVDLRWEQSAATIGLVAEIYRGQTPDFPLDETTKIARTELFRFMDFAPPEGETHYALVLISDPAATCGTCKSGAVLDYHAAADRAVSNAVRKPVVTGIEARCPLSDFQPMKSAAIYARVNVPPRVGENGSAEEDAAGASAGKTPVFDLSAAMTDTGNVGDAEDADEADERLEIVGAAVFSADTGVLNLHDGGHMVFPARQEFELPGPFTLECTVRLDTLEGMPVLVGNGHWNQCGWFLQKLGNHWRFHLAGLDCDGGTPAAGVAFHLMATWDGKTQRLYENGKLVGEKSGVPHRMPWLGGLYVGQYSAIPEASYQVRGEISRVRLYRYCKTSAVEE